MGVIAWSEIVCCLRIELIPNADFALFERTISDTSTAITMHLSKLLLRLQTFRFLPQLRSPRVALAEGATMVGIGSTAFCQGMNEIVRSPNKELL